MKNFSAYRAVLGFAALVLAFAPAAARGAAPGLSIYWVDVEGGGATLVVTPAGQSILIDTGWASGPSAERIHAAALDAGVKKIDYLVLTHFHPDHFGGAAALSRLMPIDHVLDNGVPDRNPDGMFDAGAFSLLVRPYRDFKAGHRAVIEPGRLLDLEQLPGAPQVRFRCMGARGLFMHYESDPPNPLCGTVADHAADTSDNRNSVVMVLQFGPFKFFDGGDLTWNMERQLVCPNNSIGQVDIYQTDHHGVDLSNNPLLVRSLAPTVSVMNNGPRKGGSAATLKTLRGALSIEDMYQVHKDIRGGGEFNTADPFIANIDSNCRGNFIKCTVDSTGQTYVMSIPATGFSKTYHTKAAAH